MEYLIMLSLKCTQPIILILAVRVKNNITFSNSSIDSKLGFVNGGS